MALGSCKTSQEGVELGQCSTETPFQMQLSYAGMCSHKLATIYLPRFTQKTSVLQEAKRSLEQDEAVNKYSQKFQIYPGRQPQIAIHGPR